MSQCRECEKRGCPVEGMTGMCPVCVSEYCLGHLNNHQHTMSEVRVADLRVDGIGRVGSYAQAKASHRSRNHRYWAICYFDSRQHLDRTKFGPRECSDSPHFKTKGEAETYLEGIERPAAERATPEP